MRRSAVQFSVGLHCNVTAVPCLGPTQRAVLCCALQGSTELTALCRSTPGAYRSCWRGGTARRPRARPSTYTRYRRTSTPGECTWCVCGGGGHLSFGCIPTAMCSSGAWPCAVACHLLNVADSCHPTGPPSPRPPPSCHAGATSRSLTGRCTRTFGSGSSAAATARWTVTRPTTTTSQPTSGTLTALPGLPFHTVLPNCQRCHTVLYSCHTPPSFCIAAVAHDVRYPACVVNVQPSAPSSYGRLQVPLP